MVREKAQAAEAAMDKTMDRLEVRLRVTEGRQEEDMKVVLGALEGLNMALRPGQTHSTFSMALRCCIYARGNL